MIAIGQWIKRQPYVIKWVILGVTIGIIAGLGAVLFYESLGIATDVFLGYFAKYNIPTPFSEGNSPGSAGFERPWIIPLMVAAGGLLAGAIIHFIAPEVEGHGTDAAIDAVHHNPKGIKVTVIFAKIVASALTIGSGGSGGREGPSAQISAGLGSTLTRLLDLDDNDGRTLVSVGIGAGIGSIFGAPLGGAILSAEILYSDDIDGSMLLPALVACSIGYLIFASFEGFSPLFGIAAKGYAFNNPTQLIWFGILGIVAGPVGLLYSKTFYITIKLFKNLKFFKVLKPAVAGVIVGLIAIEVPETLGTGYGWIQKALTQHGLFTIPVWIVISLPLIRILATSLSIGSGGSGGIFGPGMVIGAYCGAAVFRILFALNVPISHNPAPFVIIGMMACFGSISRAPLAVTVMVAEMTGTISVLPGAILAVAIASLIVKQFDGTIYKSQIKNRLDKPIIKP
jgi:CIC family chloride channel protein